MYNLIKLKLSVIVLLLFNISLKAAPCGKNNDYYPRSIYIPRSLSYYPILEDALTFEKRISLDCGERLFSVKPLYAQTVGNKLSRYFNIDHLNCLKVREDGSGNVNSMWFNVITPDGTYYSSDLAFAPERKAGGAMFYFVFELPCDWQITFNTALVGVRHNMNLKECVQSELGTCCPETVGQSFCNINRNYGKVCCGDLSKTGLDDIQLKFIKQVCKSDCNYWDIYGLLGIPTGKASKAVFLFEPLVGSKHVQLGLGTDFACVLNKSNCNSLSLLGELKWRYGLSSCALRSFDTISNGQWSRYMLAYNEPIVDRYNSFFAINKLTLKADVTPRNAFDLYLALHWNRNNCWQFEFGYDFFYKQSEKVCLSRCNNLDDIAMDDLLGTARYNPISASKTNISQGVLPGPNQMVSDTVYTPITLNDINTLSGAAPQTITNSIYFSGEYFFKCYPGSLGLNVAYENGTNVNAPDNVYAWINLDILF